MPNVKIVSRRLVVVVGGGFTRLEVGLDEAGGHRRKNGLQGHFAAIGVGAGEADGMSFENNLS